MDRDLLIGLVAALVVHAGFGYWAATLERPAPPVEEERLVAVAVVEDVRLPPPPPPPPPPPEPKPEPKPPEPTPEPKAEAPKPQPKPKGQPKRKNKAKPKSDKPPPDPSEPAPLVLSKTYGAGADGGGVAVQTGDEDMFGDPTVEANERNTRRRGDDDSRAKPATEGPAGNPVPEKKVTIVHARPKGRCKVDWPEGAPSSRRIVEVTLLLSIGVTGKVTPKRVLRSAGEPFDSAARRALARCAFEAGTRDGKPFVDKVPFVVEFKPGSDA
ncbi:MAG: hypothetical protein RIT45_4272 [Pseudomonadota bacterium]|jgi:protein TonB